MKALYAGSFDPFTIGHLYIVREALCIFDSLVIGIGINEGKKPMWPIEKRVQAIKSLFIDNTRVKVESYEGVTAEFAMKCGASVLVRGVRNNLDFEKEKELADINRKVFEIPTVFIPTSPDLSFVSSSMVRELIHFGQNPEKFIAGDFKLPINK